MSVKGLHLFGAFISIQIIYALVSIAAASRLSESEHIAINPNDDHWPVAKRLLVGEPLTNFRYPPGFSLYIVSAIQIEKLSGAGYFWIRLLQDSIAAGISGVLILLIIERLTSSLWLGWCGALCLIVNLPYSAGTAFDLAMGCFMPWFLAGLLLLVLSFRGAPWWRVGSFMAGVLIALSGFVRPDVLLFLPFSVVLAVVWNQVIALHRPLTSASPIKYKPILVGCLGFLVTLLPWTVYAGKTTGKVVFYSTGLVPSHIDGMKRFPGNLVSEEFAEQETAYESVGDVVRSHLLLVRRHPADWLSLWSQKLWRPWYASDSGRWDWIFGLQTVVIAPFFIAGVVFWLRQRGADMAFYLGVTVLSYFWLISLAVLSINRYMSPVYPFLGMFVGYSLQSLLRAVRKP